MNQAHIPTKVNALINNLGLLHTNYYRLSLQLDNPTFDYLRKKIIDTQSTFEREYVNYSGVTPLKKRKKDTVMITNKERVILNISYLHIIKEYISEIVSTVIASDKFKNLLIKISKLCSREIVIMHTEIKELDKNYRNIADINGGKLHRVN